MGRKHYAYMLCHVLDIRRSLLLAGDGLKQSAAITPYGAILSNANGRPWVFTCPGFSPDSMRHHRVVRVVVFGELPPQAKHRALDFDASISGNGGLQPDTARLPGQVVQIACGTALLQSRRLWLLPCGHIGTTYRKLLRHLVAGIVRHQIEHQCLEEAVSGNYDDRPTSQRSISGAGIALFSCTQPAQVEALSRHYKAGSLPGIQRLRMVIQTVVKKCRIVAGRQFVSKQCDWPEHFIRQPRVLIERPLAVEQIETVAPLVEILHQRLGGKLPRLPHVPPLLRIRRPEVPMQNCQK